ncbi:MAG: hydroxymethylglutaryl-CoA reductase, degradative [Anaerolineaceae bacterium]|nr:hydroxymethylglutaryl-CoA reductase, degradative [Anaerolineaceae bacterium]
MNENPSSRLPGLHRLSAVERLKRVAESTGLSPEESSLLAAGGGLDPLLAGQMIENCIGVFGLPLGIAPNFIVNGRELLVPLAIEEPSVLAALGNAARIFRAGGGFSADSDEPVMTGQVQLLDVTDIEAARSAIERARTEILAQADALAGSIVARGGGARDLKLRAFPQSPVGPMLVLHLAIDCRDAMGANVVNSVCEGLAPLLESLSGGRANLRILSNFSDRRRARASCSLPAAELEGNGQDGLNVAKRIVESSALAEIDPWRATTHNKGIMNGIDGVAIATGNDWRAIEAGAHAWAARDGDYRSLSHWRLDEDGDLRGSIELPLAVGTVGGATRVHPLAALCLKILGVSSARELAEIMAAVGLAQNFAALRALATEGIQRGHMNLHARQLALAAGAPPERVGEIAGTLVAGGDIRLGRAQDLVAGLQDGDSR